MNVERTMEFILQRQAKAELRMDRAEARSDRTELRFNKRLDGLAKIVRTGTKLLNQVVVERRKLAEEMRGLAAAQRRTDRTLNNFIGSLCKRRNGR